MASSRRTAARRGPLVALALLAACSGGSPDLAPSVQSIEPARGYSRVATSVTIRGDGFYARASQAGGAGDRRVETRHRAWLDDTELTEVTWVDPHTLTALVPPGLASGPHALSVENAYGERATLAAAYHVSAANSPPALTATARAAAPMASQGELVAVTIDVHNSGGSDAIGVTPVLSAGGTGRATATAPIAPQDVPAGAVRTFTATVRAEVVGDVTVRVACSARDAFTGLSIDATPAWATLTVVAPGALVLAPALSRTSVTVGQSLTLDVKITNTGGAGVKAIQPTLAAITGAGAVAAVSSPSPLDLAAGQSATVSFAFSALSPGDVALQVAAAGTDALSGAPTTAPAAAAGPLTIESPAALTTAVSLSRALVSVGQQVTMTATVANAGGAAVRAVLPTLTATPGGVRVLTAPVAAQDVAGGEAVTFTWVLDTTAVASAPIEVSAGGLEANGGQPVAAAPASAVLVVQAPAQLAAVVAIDRSQVSVGQDVTVTATLTNVGGATASGLTAAVSAPPGFGPTPVAGPPAAALRLAPGAYAVLSWTFRSVASAVWPFTMAAAAFDENSGAPVAASAATVPVAAQRPAALALAATLSRGRATAGQAVTVTVTATNAGEATLQGLQLDSVPGGAAVLTPLAAPASIDLRGGATASLVFSYATAGAGDVAVQVSGVGTDLNSGRAVAATAPPLSLTVQQPATLATTLALSPARVSAGQPVTLTATVSNAGGATVGPTTPTLAAVPPGLVARGSPAAQAVGGGSSVSFRWTLDTTAAPVAGTFRVDCAGTDTNTGDAFAAPQVSAALVVDTPAALAATAALVPAQVSIGQDVALTVRVTNTGTALAGSVATNVVPPPGVDAAPSTAPSPQDIPGGETRDFRWTFHASAAAAGGAFQATAAGVDVNSGAGLGATAFAGPLLVQVPGALELGATLSRTQATVAQTVTLRLAVHNGGEATVSGVAPLVVAAGTGAAFLVSAPPPVDVPGGALVVLDYVYSAAAAGDVTFTATASGTDENSGSPVVAPAVAAGPVAVQTQPGLVTVVAVSQQAVSVGQPVVVTADVTNGGSATALAASPALASVPAGVALRSGPAARDIPGGTTVRFQWTFDSTAATSGTFGVDCSATDANTSATVVAPRASSGTLVVQRPASLSVSATVDRSRANVGQDVTLTVTVRNTGEAPAARVETTATGQGAAAPAALASPVPAQVSLPGGAARDFVYAFHLAGPAGPATFAVTAGGADGNSGATLNASASAGPVSAHAPATLGVAIAATPSQGSLGQAVTVTMTVTNGGGADAIQVLPGSPLGQGSANGAAATLVAGPSPSGAVTITGGSSRAFTWTYTGASAGLLAFAGTASGRDANSDAYLGSDVATSPPMTLQVPAALASAFSSVPARVNRNQTFPVTITVRNTGQATATGIAPSLVATASLAPGAAPASGAPLAGGGVTTFTQSFTAGAVGPASLQGDVTATDANSGAAIAAPRISSTVVVENPASLSAALAAPGAVGVNKQFTVTMTVTNGGDAAAALVAPTSLSLTAGSTATATLVAGPTPATASVVPGAPATFSWTFLAGTTGSLQLSGSAQGYDANDGATVSAALATSPAVAITESVLLASDPFGDGTAYADLAGYRGQLSIGPSQDGGALASIAPDGSALRSGGLAFAKDTNSSGSKSSNGWSGAPPFPSLGALGCVSNTGACGPDNENGRGLFASATVGGTEWLVAVGAKPNNTVNYAYVSSDPAGSAFSYVDLTQQLSGEARTVSAAAIVAGKIFLGVTGKGGASPGLVSIDRMPAPGAGLDPGGAPYATDLAASKMPGIGNSGTPKNNAVFLLIDSLVVLQDRLYVANNGGFVRSTVPSPRAYSAAPADWAACTPAGAGAKTAVVASRLTDLEPAEKAVPQMAVFGGRLFAIRNVYLSGSSGAVGGQLWMCTPATTDAGGSLQCGAGDWTLVVPESNADGRQEATLLVATSRYLYLGFNDGSGVRLFRTSRPAPASLSDFGGMAGCVAGAPGCQGLGGNGFGDASNRRLFSSTTLGDAQGDVHLYLATGDTTSAPAVPVRIYRIEE